jgi:hypothetical protein
MWKEVKKEIPCVHCGRSAKRHSIKKKEVNTELGKTMLVFSKHYCPSCDKYFTNPASEKHAPIRRNVSWGLLWKAVELAKTMSLDKASAEIQTQTGYSLSPTTLHDWVSNSEELRRRFEEIMKKEGV